MGSVDPVTCLKNLGAETITVRILRVSWTQKMRWFVPLVVMSRHANDRHLGQMAGKVSFAL